MKNQFEWKLFCFDTYQGVGGPAMEEEVIALVKASNYQEAEKKALRLTGRKRALLQEVEEVSMSNQGSSEWVAYRDRLRFRLERIRGLVEGTELLNGSEVSWKAMVFNQQKIIEIATWTADDEKEYQAFIRNLSERERKAERERVLDRVKLEKRVGTEKIPLDDIEKGYNLAVSDLEALIARLKKEE